MSNRVLAVSKAMCVNLGREQANLPRHSIWKNNPVLEIKGQVLKEHVACNNLGVKTLARKPTRTHTKIKAKHFIL